jgi:hypothetical protein
MCYGYRNVVRLVCDMSIRLSRTVTAARLIANRRSSLKSTGPRTDAGKRRSSLNAFRGGGRSKTRKLFWQVLMTAPVGKVLQTADRLMTHEQRTHPRIEALLEFHWSPQDIEAEVQRRKARRRIKKRTVEA